jgi:hypothetical protein
MACGDWLARTPPHLVRTLIENPQIADSSMLCSNNGPIVNGVRRSWRGRIHQALTFAQSAHRLSAQKHAMRVSRCADGRICKSLIRPFFVPHLSQ